MKPPGQPYRQIQMQSDRFVKSSHLVESSGEATARGTRQFTHYQLPRFDRQQTKNFANHVLKPHSQRFKLLLPN
jgi:hypothetical protein